MVDVSETPRLLALANDLVAHGIKTKDALHVASAVEGSADYFVTSDDRLLRKLALRTEIKAATPLGMIEVINEHND
ncbi:hypothetical protein [Thiorhodococcus minor]|uniref:hypothetical protein n=1 Tax=Thiorhodococcus minor TaxID=57489 RepID=UPI001ADADD95|nr:hypothetical protein [Thiorhodococcus minor]